jgi:hypothetical protein
MLIGVIRRPMKIPLRNDNIGGSCSMLNMNKVSKGPSGTLRTCLTSLGLMTKVWLRVTDVDSSSMEYMNWRHEIAMKMFNRRTKELFSNALLTRMGRSKNVCN